MTKREAKKLATYTAAILCLQATQTEIYIEDNSYTDAEVEMLRRALKEISDELFRRSER